MNNNNDNKRSPAFDLEALSKAYEQSLSGVKMGDKDIPMTAKGKRPAPKRELKSFTPKDYRPHIEATPEHDKIVDKIRADRRKRSHSVWTDNPVLKPKKSVWIDDSSDDETAPPVRQTAVPQPKNTVTPPFSGRTYYTGMQTPPVKTEEKPAQRKLPDDIVMPLPVMTEAPEPDLGKMVGNASDDIPEDQVVPILREKPRKQELVVRVDNEGDTMVRSVPQRVNKQKVTVDMSGYREEEDPDSPNKRTISLQMPVWKMKTASAEETEKKQAPKPAPKPAAKAVEEDKTVTFKAVEKADAAKVKAETVKETAAETVKVIKDDVKDTADEVKKVTADAVPDTQSVQKKPDDEAYDFSSAIDKVRSDKKGKEHREDETDSTDRPTAVFDSVKPVTREIKRPAHKEASSHKAAATHKATSKKSTVKQKKPRHHELEFQFINCIMCLGVVFVLFFSLLYMDRDNGYIESANAEHRDFPRFNLDSYLTGEYVMAIDSFYADTIPGRGELKKFGEAYHRAKGIGDGAETAAAVKPAVTEKPAEDTSSAAEESSQPEKTESQADDSSKTEDNKNEVVKLPEKLDDGALADDVIVFGKENEVRAAGAFYGNFETGSRYAQTVNRYKEAMPDINIYNMTIPTSAAYYLPNNFKDSVADQKDNIDNAASQLKSIVNVDIYDTLGEHSAEYIYSRTDHRWQPLGAYYAGKVFADKAGVDYTALDYYWRYEIYGFTGTYCDSSKDSELTAYPDTFVYYKPDNMYTVKVYDTHFANGKDGSLFNEYAQGSDCYYSILGSDEQITEIDTSVSNGRTLVIFKDSFGNALVPFLTNSFEKIYVCDLRYFKVNAVEFCRAVGCTDLLFAVSVNTCSNDMSIKAINNDLIQAGAVKTETADSTADNSIAAESAYYDESSTAYDESSAEGYDNGYSDYVG